MKKIIILVIVVVILIIIGGILYYVFGRSAASSTPNGTSSGPSVDTDSLAPISQGLPQAPTTPTFTLGTAKGDVQIKNFYLTSMGVDGNGVVLIESNANYFVSYDTTDSTFWIAITSTPFATWRTTAENDFVNLLGVTNADACKLTVSEGVPYSAGNPLDGQSFPLSFCSGSL